VDFERSGGLSKKTMFRKTHCIKKRICKHCAPCTRAIKRENIRAGRWWWESSHKEVRIAPRVKRTNTKKNNNNREVLVEVTTTTL
jgi:hypothetical protein